MKNEITAKRLVLALSNANMKARELADKSGVNKSSISQYVNGTHAPSNINAGKMAKVLGVNPVWLMGYDVPMNSDITTDEYYIDQEAAKFAEFLRTHPEYSWVFDAVRKVKPEDLEKAVKVLGVFSENNNE